MTPLFRYGLIPGRLRRLHIAARIAIACVIVISTVVILLAILRLSKSALQGFSLAMIPIYVLFIGLPSLLCIFGAFAGATLIAGERQKETWETLLLCRLPAYQIVLTKMAACIAFCLISALPATIWWTALVYKLALFDFSTAAAQTHTILRYRIVVFLAWSFLQMVGRIIPFVTFGMAVSSRCRRVNGALMFCAAIFTVYGVLFWQLFTTFGHQEILNGSSPGLPLQLFRWPVIPFLSGDYGTARDILTKGWQTNLAADLIWLVAVPLLLLIPTIAWSRLSRRATRPARRSIAA